MKRANMRSEMSETAIKGRRYEKSPARTEKRKNINPKEIYDSNLLYQMRRASRRS